MNHTKKNSAIIRLLTIMIEKIGAAQSGATVIIIYPIAKIATYATITNISTFSHRRIGESQSPS